VDTLNAGERLVAVACHVARENDVANLFGLPCAGTVLWTSHQQCRDELLTASVVDAEPAVWNKIIEGNLTGAFLCARQAARIMRERKRGKIISISSTAGSRAAPPWASMGSQRPDWTC
jgi:NAD(P)-dependent dehydrogenase (short-subunit alcohol dehydrogenase family)